MKIAYVSDAIWPYNKGGKEKRLFDVATRLSLADHDVHIYTMKWWMGSDIKKENGLTLHAICKKYPLYEGPRRSIKQGLLFGLACFKLIKENWDIVDVDHMPFFPLYSVKLVCLLKNKKMYATWHEVWGKEYWNEYLGTTGFVAYVIEKISMYLPNKFISVSDHTTRKLENEIGLQKIITIPDGIDIDHIIKIKPSTTKSDVIYAGRLLSHKNIDVLIRSIAIVKKKFPSIKCLLTGEGPEKIRLEKLVEKLDLKDNVKFLGFVEDHDEMLGLVKSAKVFVLPSSREGFGIVAIEANACGIPVITIDHEANASKDLIVDGLNGFVCKLDENAIAENIIKIINKSFNKVTCIKSANKYDWKNIVEKIEKEYVR